MAPSPSTSATPTKALPLSARCHHSALILCEAAATNFQRQPSSPSGVSKEKWLSLTSPLGMINLHTKTDDAHFAS